jgi:hypothetical protein
MQAHICTLSYKHKHTSNTLLPPSSTNNTHIQVYANLVAGPPPSRTLATAVCCPIQGQKSKTNTHKPSSRPPTQPHACNSCMLLKPRQKSKLRSPEQQLLSTPCSCPTLRASTLLGPIRSCTITKVGGCGCLWVCLCFSCPNDCMLLSAQTL